MNTEEKNKKRFLYKCGITHFSKQTERNVLFFMTVAMLVWGIVETLLNNIS